jgi:hypothetical protein
MFRKALLASTLIVTAAALHYAVPQTDVVRAVGVETKWMDGEGDQTTQGVGRNTRDVYFIQTETADTRSPRVYRNEDRLLPYLKWNSADLQSRSQSLASDRQLVEVRHYGWRIPLFSIFPNTLRMNPIDAAYTPVPYSFLVLLGLTWAGIFFGHYKSGRILEGFRERRRAKADRRRAKTRAPADAGSDVDDFLSGTSGNSDGGSDD